MNKSFWKEAKEAQNHPQISFAFFYFSVSAEEIKGGEKGKKGPTAELLPRFFL